MRGVGESWYWTPGVSERGGQRHRSRGAYIRSELLKTTMKTLGQSWRGGGAPPDQEGGGAEDRLRS